MFAIHVSDVTIVPTNSRFAYAVAALVCGVTINAGAQVYRCTTPSGSTEYSQVPCGKDAQLLQNREKSIDRGPVGDPFGVARERERVRLETERLQALNRKLYSTPQSAPSNSGPYVRPIDRYACEAADRDAHIESRHARKDAAAIRRKQKLADWECGRNVPDDPVATSPSVIPMKVAPPPPIITSCDQSGCWDSNGGRYNRAGNTSTFFGPSGACTKSGMSMVCP